jgi:hypothetical protein
MTEPDIPENIFTSMRQVDFARERTAMCGADITDVTATLGSVLASLYGEAAADLDLHQTLQMAVQLRQQMQRCRLLLVQHDLIEISKAAITAMDATELAALDDLPPLPEETIFAFERPRMFKCTNPYNRNETFTKGLSIIVPFDPTDFPFESVHHEEFTGYVGYLRLVDQERIFADVPQIESRWGDFDTRRELASFRRKREMWLPSLINELDAAFEGETVTIEKMLRLALARAGEQRSTTVPRGIQRAAEGVGVRRQSYRSVLTIELPAPAQEHGDAEPTGRTISCEFDVGHEWRYVTDENGNNVFDADGNKRREYGHWRRFRDTDGNVIKKVWVKQYPKGKGKPRKPDAEAVTVAREPGRTEGPTGAG